jgi:hypothetical protein
MTAVGMAQAGAPPVCCDNAGGNFAEQHKYWRSERYISNQQD